MVAERPVDLLAVGVRAVPLRTPFHDFAVAAQVEIGAERISDTGRRYPAKRPSRPAAATWRRVSDATGISRPAWIALGMDLNHFRPGKIHESRRFDRVSVSSHLGRIDRVMIFMQEIECSFVPIPCRLLGKT